MPVDMLSVRLYTLCVNKTVCIEGGMYELFAGRDASRSLATMQMSVSDKYDDLEDLSQNEREKLSHWEKQFTGM